MQYPNKMLLFLSVMFYLYLYLVSCILFKWFDHELYLVTLPEETLLYNLYISWIVDK